MLLAAISKEVIRWSVMLFFGFPTAFITDVTDVMDKMKLNYEIVEKYETIPGALAVFVPEENKTYFTKRAVGNSGGMLRIYAAHELIHQLRYNNGLWTGNKRIEEAVAIYGTKEMSREIGFGMVFFRENDMFKTTLKVNNLPFKWLTEQEEALVENEIDKTIKLIK